MQPDKTKVVNTLTASLLGKNGRLEHVKAESFGSGVASNVIVASSIDGFIHLIFSRDSIALSYENLTLTPVTDTMGTGSVTIGEDSLQLIREDVAHVSMQPDKFLNLIDTLLKYKEQMQLALRTDQEKPKNDAG